MPCNRCGSENLQTDNTSGLLVCINCGVIQSVDNFQDQYGGFSGTVGTFVRVGYSTNYSYKERKEYEASKTIEDVTCRLSFSQAHANEVKDMVRTVTDGELGAGDWFPILVGACSYVSMRQKNKPLPITEVAAVVSCDVFELGRMVSRVVARLELQLPEFDMLGMLERSMKDFFGSGEIRDDRLGLMIKQGYFILQCAIKWSLSTGRRPGPLVAAVLVIVAELNGIRVKIKDVALHLNVPVSTSKKRYNEVLDALVKVAQKNLPWGKDVNAKNIMKNAHFVIQYMDMKSRESQGVKTRRCKEEDIGCDLEPVASPCLTKEVESTVESDLISDDGVVESDCHLSCDGRPQDSDSTVNGDASEDSKISPETLAKLYEKFRINSFPLKLMEEIEGNHRGSMHSTRGDLELYDEWWSGRSELCRKLLLDQLSQQDVGFDPLPPAYVRGFLAAKRRKEKIKVAKMRIRQVLGSQDGESSCDKPLSCSETCSNGKMDSPLSESKNGHRKRKRMHDQDIDWEDFIIETLLLHRVEEKEIEKGHYKVLLDLHVFNSVTAL